MNQEEEDQRNFYIRIQTQMQFAMLKIFLDNASEAKQVKATLEGLGDALGSSIASIFYEMISDKKQEKGGLTDSQEQMMIAVFHEITKAYVRKVEIIANPLAFSKIAVNVTRH
jgi:hypothetical protein